MLSLLDSFLLPWVLFRFRSRSSQSGFTPMHTQSMALQGGSQSEGVQESALENTGKNNNECYEQSRHNNFFHA